MIADPKQDLHVLIDQLGNEESGVACVHGERGVLAYDAATDRVQCHVCGGWYRALWGEHLQRHGLTAAAYKERYEIPRATRLESPRITLSRARKRAALAAQHVEPITMDTLYGERGVLAYDELADRVQCHACGGWYQKLTTFHLKRHGLTVWDYKELYGLNDTTPLLTPRLSARQREIFFQRVEEGVFRLDLPFPRNQRPGRKHRAEYFRRHQTPEKRAEAGRIRQGWTDEALLDALRVAQAAYGGTLTSYRLRCYHAAHPDLVPSHTTVESRFGSWRRVWELLGQPYRTTRLPLSPGSDRQWTDEAIFDALRALEAELGRPLGARCLYQMRSGRKGKAGAFPSYKTVRDRFGSWQRVRELMEQRAADERDG